MRRKGCVDKQGESERTKKFYSFVTVLNFIISRPVGPIDHYRDQDDLHESDIDFLFIFFLLLRARTTFWQRAF